MVNLIHKPWISIWEVNYKNYLCDDSENLSMDTILSILLSARSQLWLWNYGFVQHPHIGVCMLQYLGVSWCHQFTFIFQQMYFAYTHTHIHRQNKLMYTGHKQELFIKMLKTKQDGTLHKCRLISRIHQIKCNLVYVIFCPLHKKINMSCIKRMCICLYHDNDSGC